MEFKAKDWVLVRDDEAQKWKLDIFSHYCNDGSSYPYICIGDYYDECLPYEGNEALLGTTDALRKEDGWKVGDKVEVLCVDDEKWYDGKIVKINTERDRGFFYYVNAKCFFLECKWCRADQLRRPEEKPEEEKEWRPKRGEAVEALMNDEWQAATLILDDHTDFAPYHVRLQNGDTTWCTEKQVRPTQKEPFKFGDKVKVDFAGDWREAVIIEIDTSSIPYKVATPDGDIHWCTKSRIRRA